MDCFADVLHQCTYGHDRNSNRLWRDNVVASVAGKKLDEQYEYDNLNRLDKFRRGVLDGDTIPTTGDDCARRENWGLSPVGNWNDYQIDSDGDDNFTDAADLDQDRTHNLVNEIWNETPANAITEGQGQTAWASPVYSARGNMTTVPDPSDLTDTYTCSYDAWNRLAFVWVDSNSDGDHDAGETVIARYEYDGRNRRTKKHLNADTDDDFDEYRHFYYNASWQILETRKSTSENTLPQTLKPERQYVWSVRYIDAPVLRDENKDDDDDCIDGQDERLYYLTDANFNVTCLVNTGGVAVERYVYDPYGKVTILNGANNVDKDGAVTEWTEDGDQTASDVDNSHLYCGYYQDWETGLYHVRRRTLHPYFGWVQRDPIGYADGMSLYEYVRCQPAHALDFSGLEGFRASIPPMTIITGPLEQMNEESRAVRTPAFDAEVRCTLSCDDPASSTIERVRILQAQALQRKLQGLAYKQVGPKITVEAEPPEDATIWHQAQAVRLRGIGVIAKATVVWKWIGCDDPYHYANDRGCGKRVVAVSVGGEALANCEVYRRMRYKYTFFDRRTKKNRSFWGPPTSVGPVEEVQRRHESDYKEVGAEKVCERCEPVPVTDQFHHWYETSVVGSDGVGAGY